MNCVLLSGSPVFPLLSALQTWQCEKDLGWYQWVTNERVGRWLERRSLSLTRKCGEKVWRHLVDRWGWQVMVFRKWEDVAGEWDRMWHGLQFTFFPLLIFFIWNLRFHLSFLSISLSVYACLGVQLTQFVLTGQEKCFPHLVYPTVCPLQWKPLITVSIW